MANYIISYDLNGPNPSHKQVDEVLEKLGAIRARILETVWYVGWAGTRGDLYKAVNGLMSTNDQLIVIEALAASFRNLLVTDDSFKAAWIENG